MRTKLFLALTLTLGPTPLAQSPSTASSPLAFTSSTPWLNDSFHWAKQQALAYVRPNASIGPWYEAALPGRNAFCMRDVSHQTEGAAVLGLSDANHNMLGRFTASAAESRDWAAYWEITSEGKPSPDDYVSDDDFWFNLPANFDVLDASARMMRWTGDARHQHDPALEAFATLTMSNYLKAWQLEPGKLLNRPRIANRRLPEGRFVNARGIPSYSEGTSDFLFGTDLLASEYRAMKSFREISADRNLLQTTERNATAIQALLERV